MERNTKSFISILIICLLSVISIVSLFVITPSATPSYTEGYGYTPNGSVDITFHSTNILFGDEYPLDSEGSFLHFPATLTSGSDYTWTEFGTYPSTHVPTGIIDPLRLSVYSFDADTITEAERFVSNRQYLNCVLQTESNHVIQMDITLRDFYLFDGFFDYIDSTVTSSIELYLTSETDNGIYSSMEHGSAKWRYRRIGDDSYSNSDIAYSDVVGSSHAILPYTTPMIDELGAVSYESFTGTNYLRITDLTNYAPWQEDELYHFEFLTLSFYLDPLSFNTPSSFVFGTDIGYTDVLNIDNITINIDKSNIHIPPRDLGSWLGKATTGFFSAEFIPGFSFGGLVVVVLSFVLLIWFLKLFAGG